MPRYRGLSLAELLVAVGILAILGVIAMPAFSSLMQTYRLNAATLELVSHLRSAQSLAVSNGASYRLHWGSDAAVNQPNTYRVEKNPYTDADAITNWKNIGTSYPGITLANPTLPAVEFNYRGSTANAITLSVSSTNGTTYTIQVRRTGSVKCFKDGGQPCS